MYDIIVFRSRVFVRQHENENPAAFKKNRLSEQFQKPSFLVPENAFKVWTEG